MERNNAYGFSYGELTEEEIIRGCIESDVPVFLHGRSSDGKSARVKQIDPDCVVLYLRNATPDSLNGKSVYVPPVTKRVAIPTKKEVNGKLVEVIEYEDVIVEEGHMLDIKPSWLIKLEENCNKEPDKIHLVFFDEITNALHTIQGMAFNIVLDREVNGKWKLPPNARVVSAGNDLEDSRAANTLVEPLFNRFAHTYIETTINSWLEWASTPTTSYKRSNYNGPVVVPRPIHPAIYGFVALKAKTGTNVLRTRFDGIKPNADPRKWEMASKVLYTTKKPEMLRSLVGKGVTSDFVNFCKMKIISIEDIINGNYNSRDYDVSTDQKYATALALSEVDEENVSSVREFIKKMGPEILNLFDDFWTNGNPDRIRQLEDIRSMGLTWRRR